MDTFGAAFHLLGKPPAIETTGSGSSAVCYSLAVTFCIRFISVESNFYKCRDALCFILANELQFKTSPAALGGGVNLT